MNKRKLAPIVFLTLFLFGVPSHPAYAGSMFKKIGRGFVNVATSPFEILCQTARIARVDKKPAVAAGAGVFQGIYFMMMRILSGVYDIVTFPLPVPFHYDSLIQPETVFDGFQSVSDGEWPYPASGFGRYYYRKKIF
jgi:putative exosortase-associated protein (TIGR04073 family)